MLGKLLELAHDDKPLYDNALEMPYFLKRVMTWVRFGLEERKKVDEALRNTTKVG